MAKSDHKQEVERLERKALLNELRARDAEARLRIVTAEIEILEKKERLAKLKDSG